MSDARRIRAFFAVPVEGEAGEELARVVSALAGSHWGDRVRWVPSENLHLTLRFLGDVGAERLDVLLAAVRDAVRDVATTRCRLDAVRAFPSRARSRVIVASITPEAGVVALQSRVEEAVCSAGISREPRRFRAHVTLGRVRRPPLRGVEVDAEIAPVAFGVDRVVLYRSDLRPTGARYTSLGEAPLA